MRTYSCNFEGCTAMTDKIGYCWETVDWLPTKWCWIILAVPYLGTILSLASFLKRDGRYVWHFCPEHAMKIKGLVRKGS